MPLVQKTTGPVPDTIKARTQFAASGSLSQDDLYWVLYRAASEQPNSAEAFCSQVKSQIDAALGAGNYVMTISISPNEGGGSFDYEGTKLPNVIYWSGNAGILPGFGRTNGICCVVFWG